MSDTLLHQMEKMAIVQHNKDVMRHLCGLDFEIRRPDGSRIVPPSEKSTHNKHIERTSSLQPSCTHCDPNCASIDSDALNSLHDTLEPQTYNCLSGRKKIMIPIILDDTLIGIVFTGENSIFRFQVNQCDTIIEILKKFTDYIIKNELTPLNLYLQEDKALTRQRELLNRAVNYIRKNYHSNNLTLSDVSMNNGISYHYLSRIFKSELKTTFAQFRSKVRMEAASKLLKNKRLSVTQISNACGFDDPAYFCKVFKGHFGKSPLGYRAQKIKPRLN